MEHRPVLRFEISKDHIMIPGMAHQCWVCMLIYNQLRSQESLGELSNESLRLLGFPVELVELQLGHLGTGWSEPT